jgi:ribokinase
MQPRIAVVGSLNMDLVVRARRIPLPGETIIGGEFATFPGGKGANQAVAAARLGARVAMIGRVGSDSYADVLLRNLTDADIDHSFVTRDPEVATGVAFIIVAESGQNSIVVASGANARLTPADVDAAEQAIARTDALVVQLESPLETVIRAAEVAHRHGVAVVLNPAPARPLPQELLSLVDILIPNESETQLLTDMPVGDRGQLTIATEALHRMGVRSLVVTLGRRGSFLSQDGEQTLVPAFPVTPVDTTAAGDAFVAALTVAMAGGLSLVDALRWGNAAGALTATRLGAQTSLPSRSEVEALLQKTASGESMSHMVAD